MVRKPARKHQRSKQRCQELDYVGRSVTVQNLLFCAHTQCISYVTNTSLLVRSSVRSKQLLCFVHGQGQKSEQKPTTKNFDGFHNHSLLLTMIKIVIVFVRVLRHNSRALTQRLKNRRFIYSNTETHTSRSLFSHSNAIR